MEDKTFKNFVSKGLDILNSGIHDGEWEVIVIAIRGYLEAGIALTENNQIEENDD